MPIPNVVIAGVPKAGTSSLFNWLCAHPEVSSSTVKETFFLVDRGHPLTRPGPNYHTHGLAGYATYFPRASRALRLEATTHYLYQQTALDVLSGLDPQPHVIFLLRNPADRILSSFQYSQHTIAHLDRRLSFGDFIQAIREKGGGLERAEPEGRVSPLWLNEMRYSLYLPYLRRWKERFGPGRLHVFLFEDLKASPGDVMRSLCERLGIDPAFYDDYDYPKHNETYRVRSIVLQRLARRIGAVLPYGDLRAAMRRQYLRFFAEKGAAERNEEERRVLRHLQEEYAPFNRELEVEFGLDLRPWRVASEDVPAAGATAASTLSPRAHLGSVKT